MLSTDRLRAPLLVAVLFAVLAVAAACGASDATDAAVIPTEPAVPTVPGGDTAGNGLVAAALTIDPSALPNYAAQTLPASYTAQVLQREDRGGAGNPITNAGATLGRVLFFDRRLSRNDSLSCASCHAQSTAFGDSAQFSLGFEGVGRAGAHTMRLANARFNASGEYFWDRRAPSLQAQVIQPIQDAVEMGFDAAHGGLAAALAKVSAVPFYARLFTLAFGNAAVTQDRVQRALAQYVRSIVSVQSRWDVAVAASGGGAPFQQPMPGFSAQESRGQQLFLAPPQANGLGCAGCHVPPSFSIDANSRSNGLDAGETRIFRSPSLKTVGMGNRYMHDGRHATLEEVVEFYDSAVQPGPALDPRLANPNGTPRRLNLSAADKAAVVAFLRTLRDTSLAADPRFRDPFRR